MSGLTDTWMTPQEQHGGMLCFFKSEEEVTIATLFTSETPKGFCGLKPFTQPSLGTVVSR